MSSRRLPRPVPALRCHPIMADGALDHKRDELCQIASDVLILAAAKELRVQIAG